MLTSTRDERRARARQTAKTKRTRPSGNRWLTPLIVVGIVGLVAAAIFLGDGPGGGSATGTDTGPGGYAYQVGQPGPGEPAPPITLTAAGGGTFTLTDARGETVLLYFQEGLMCQPCWDQLTDIEARWGDFEQLGIDRIVTITTDPVDALGQKVQLEGISSAVLSDAGKRVSRAYDTLAYGMMGGSHNGHSFIVVGPDGQIVWRADYGGAPDYTMRLPVDALLKDLRAGVGGGEAG